MSDRVSRLLNELGGNAEMMLVTSMLNVRYLTGYTGSTGLVLIGPDRRVFVTNFLYVEQAANEVDDSFDRVIASADLIDELPELLGTGELQLAFEDSAMTVATHAHLREKLPERVTLVAAGRPVERLRAVKERAEIEHIRTATQIADAALLHVLEQGIVGRTEVEVAIAIESEIRRRGASASAFKPIVASGAHGAQPHLRPLPVRIEAGQLVVVDWGAVVDGYLSDGTRTFSTGKISETAQSTYDLVRRAQEAGLDAARPGIDVRKVDAAARDVIEAAGHGEHFGHGLGHGIGLEVHEAPTLSRRGEGELAPGNVITIEPGVYLPGEHGVRIEDLCVVTESGCEVISGISKELTTLG